MNTQGQHKLNNRKIKELQMQTARKKSMLPKQSAEAARSPVSKSRKTVSFYRNRSGVSR
jgi:hypothetical protein